ncbi:uncharacterized protein PRCAT00004296001 [Priceomyces carsonii]|uniref:uncharacterized protein n=1 Tax=Priceomyces carsonii TaxID=28549 RepID=UPI002ED88378|nr:unnamed protein product [Priceomyces carsonii]
MTKKIFLSGATGFIAQHIVKQLLERGYYVVGTVRSNEKGDKLKSLLNSERFSYEVVKDIQSEGAFDEALKRHPDINVFLHTASPFYFDVTDVEKDLLLPAVSGTSNAFKAIKKYGTNVRKVVITSSLAAIIDMNHFNDPKFKVNEESWNPVTWEDSKLNALFAYCGSKAFAEKEAWKFLREEKPNFTLSTINPVYVFGPQAFDQNAKGTLNTSAEIIQTLLGLKPNDPVPDVSGQFIDVRDVARAHIEAFEKDSLSGKRLLLSEANFNDQILLNIINEKFPKLAHKLPVGKPEATNLSLAVVDNTATKSLLGFKFNDLETCVIDTVNQYLRVNNL